MPDTSKMMADAEAFAETLMKIAKDNPALRAKLTQMVEGPMNARNKIEDLVTSLMDGKAGGPAVSSKAVVVHLIATALALVYVDTGAQRGKTRDIVDSLLDPILDRVERESDQTGATEMMHKLNAAKDRGDKAEYDRLQRKLREMIAQAEGEVR